MAQRGPTPLGWIVAFKAVKAASLFALGVVLIATRRVPSETLLARAALSLHLPLTSRLVERAMALAVSLTPRRELALGFTAVAYGALFATEAVGLWRRASWARWLTVVTTSLLVPLEIYEIVRRATPLRLLVLLVNIAVVVYLVREKELFEGPAR